MKDHAQSDTWPPEAPSEARDQHDAPESTGPEHDRQASSLAMGAEDRLAVIDPAQLAEISDRLEQLRMLFETRIIEGEQQQQWLTQLISQLAEYRNDFVFNNITGRIFRDLIQMYDTFGQTLDAAAHQGITREDIIARMHTLRRQVLKIFDRQGVQQIESDSGMRFDEAEQEAIDVRSADRPEDDGIVLESVRSGFRYGARLLRPESVIVGRYEAKRWEADD